MADRDQYMANEWHRFRRDTAFGLFGLGFLALTHFVYLLYTYFVLHEPLNGGTTAAVVLLCGTALLVASGWSTWKTWRSKESHRPMWWTLGLVATGLVVPVIVMYVVL